MRFGHANGTSNQPVASQFPCVRKPGIHSAEPGMDFRLMPARSLGAKTTAALPTATQWKWIISAALAHPKSSTWAGYWHREKRGGPNQ